MTSKRLRLIGLLGAVTVPLTLGTLVPASALNLDDPNFDPCTSLSGNLVRNCGFEAAVGVTGVPGWDHLVSVNSGVSGAANSGSHSLRFGSTTKDDVWTQTVNVSPHTKYIVGAEVEALGTSPVNDLTITVTNNAANPGVGTTIYSTQDTQIADWTRVGQIVTSGGGRTMTITITGANVPNQSYVDDVFMVAQPAGCAPIANNAVRNCGFEAADPAPWVHSVSANSGMSDSDSYGGDRSMYFASTGTKDVWYQILTVRPHTTYTLRYWDYYTSGDSAPTNSLTLALSNVAASGGQLKIAKTNVPNQQWRQVTRTFTTGSGSSAVLMLFGNNGPASNRVDDFSLTVAPKLRMAKSGKSVVTTLTGLGGQKVQLQKQVGSHWALVHTFTAPKAGVTKAWALKVSKGKYRAVAKSAPGYLQVTSNIVRR